MQNKVKMLKRHYHRDRTSAKAWGQSEPCTNRQAEFSGSANMRDENESRKIEPAKTRLTAEVIPVQLDSQAVADALAPVLQSALIQAPGRQVEEPRQPGSSEISRHVLILVLVLAVLAFVSIICALMSLWVAASNARVVSKLQALILAR